VQGRWYKNFQRSQRKKDQKIAKKPKKALLSLFRGEGGQQKKRLKMVKETPKNSTIKLNL